MSEENNNLPEDDDNDLASSGAKPAVAAAPGKMAFILIAAVVVIGIIIKSLFFSSTATPPPPKPQKEKVVEDRDHLNDSNVGLPTPPPPVISSTPVVAPPPPPPPPPVIEAPSPPQISANKTPQDEALKLRIHSSMISGGGGSAASAAGSATQKKRSAVANSSDPNSAFSQSATELSEAQVTVATRIGDLSRTIAQGKVVEGVLETALDSSLPGTIRAIVSHDTYAESGRKILIPKGSRIIGTYNSSIRRGQARVFIVWSRVIRPDGVDIAIDSPGADALGRAGMTGDVDNKYFEAFSSAILVSALDIGVAATGDTLFGKQQQTTTTNPDGGSTTNSSPTATAMQNAVQSIGSVGQTIVGNALNLSPTINIDQGTRINILVNKDLLFPDSVTGGGSSFIQ